MNDEKAVITKQIIRETFLADVTLARSQNKSVSKYTYHTITLRWHRTLAAYGHWVSMTTRWMHRRKCKCTRVRSKHPGNEMGNPKHGCSVVRVNNTGSPGGQERDRKGCFQKQTCAPRIPVPLLSASKHLGNGCCTTASFSFWLSRSPDIAGSQDYQVCHAWVLIKTEKE